MGNTGRPSKGCILCAKRRVKCDEARPGCSRCEKIGQQCPGYINEDGWVFRDENDRARRKALRLPKKSKQYAGTNPRVARKAPHKRQATSSLCAEESIRPPKQPRIWRTKLQRSKSGRSDHSESLDYNTISQSLALDLELRSVCLFMDTFTLSDPPNSASQNPSYLDFLPDLYISSKPGSCLRESVSAVAQCNFLNRYGAHGLSKWAAQSYGRALALTNQALADRRLALSDETIASVFLLGLHELLSHNEKPKPTESSAWASHTAGTCELLRMRGPEQLSTTRGRQLFRLVHSPILIKTIMQGQDPPQESIELVKSMHWSKPHAENGPALISTYFQRVTGCRAKILRLIKRRTLGLSRTEFKQAMTELLDEGEDVDRSFNMSEWALERPAWLPKLKLESLSTTPSSRCITDRYYFSTVYLLGQWARYWTTRMCLFKSLLDGLRAMAIGDVSSAALCLSLKHQPYENIIRYCADEILGSLSFAFGELDSDGVSQPCTNSYFASSVGSLHVFWSLGVIAHSPYTTMDQRESSREALQKIGIERGIAQAMYHL